MNKQSLEHWLDAATKGLPTEIVARTRQEIECHYLDAVEDYQRRGMTLETAQAAAVDQLGEARHVLRSLRETHLSTRQYATAAVLTGLAPVIAMCIGALLGARFVYSAGRSPAYADEYTVNLQITITAILFFGLTVYGCIMLRRLVISRFSLRHVDRPLYVLMTGHAIVSFIIAVLPLFLFILYREMLQNPDIPVSESSTFAGNTMIVSFDIGLLLISGGLLWLANRLWTIRQELYKLFVLLCFALIYTAIALIVVRLVSSDGLSVEFINLLFGVFASLFVVPYWILGMVFWYAAYGRAARRVRTA
jgi:hypothetical protein